MTSNIFEDAEVKLLLFLFSYFNMSPATLPMQGPKSGPISAIPIQQAYQRAYPGWLYDAIQLSHLRRIFGYIIPPVTHRSWRTVLRPVGDREGYNYFLTQFDQIAR
jgi:hypothetical protein